MPSITSSLHSRARSRGYSYSSVPSAENHFRKNSTANARALMMMEDDGELDTNMDPKINALGEEAPRLKDLELGFEGLDIYPGLEELGGDSSLRRVLSTEKEAMEDRTHSRKGSKADAISTQTTDKESPTKEHDIYPGLDELSKDSSLKQVLSGERMAMEENEKKGRESRASLEFVEVGSPGGSSVGGKAVLVNKQEKRRSGLSLHIVEGDEDDGTRGKFSPHGADNESDLVEVPLGGHRQSDGPSDIPSEPSRPVTPGSLFKDFDGVHCPSETSLPSNPPRPGHRQRRSTMTMPPPPPGPGMVYYPAPVPAVLNLPPRISKPRDSRNDMARRSQMPLQSGTEKPRRNSVRASVVLDNAPLQLEKDSAVDTLESILDASAQAPPAAFTDHPLTSAPVISYSYRNSQFPPSARLSTFNPLAPPPARAPSDQSESPIGSRSASPLPPPVNVDDTILPTTLLAELENRKAKQRLRNRTAADVSAYGIRNTLLELDAVAQVQAEQRKNKKTYLAWQTKPEGEESDDDEDVPLAMLQAAKGAEAANSGNPHKRNAEGRKPEIKLGGLLMQKELEDTEPLSKRRTRLLMEKRKSTMTLLPMASGSSLAVPQGPAAHLPDDDEDEGETLAQRRERLKKKRETLLPDINTGGSLGLDEITNADDDEEEETLAQRRERLRREKEKKEKEARRSGNVLGSTPAGGIRMVGGTTARPSMAANARQSSYGFPPPVQPQQQPTLLQQQEQMRMQMSAAQRQMQMQQAQMGYGGMRPMSTMQAPPMLNPMMGNPTMNNMGMNMGMGMMSPGQVQDVRILAMQQGFVPLDQKQRDMVERWRSSIV